MKVCIIGSTGHFGYVLKGLQGQMDAELVGVAPGSAGERMEGLHGSLEGYGYSPGRFDSYMEMLDELKPDVAAIACHFNDHAAVLVQALNRGIHVFAEKPIATMPDGLDAVIDAYRKSGAKLAAMFGMRYMPCFLTAKKLLKEGAIGDIRLMNAQKSYKLGERSELFKHRETYGGTIPWVGSHAIDWLRWFSGETFQSVYASHTAAANNGHHELEATALCHFTLSGDVFGSVSIDYLRPRAASSHSDDRIRIVGTRGVLEVRERKVWLTNGERQGTHEMPLLPERQCFADFLQQVRGEGMCMVSAEDSFAVTEASLKARQSADERRVVYF